MSELGKRVEDTCKWLESGQSVLTTDMAHDIRTRIAELEAALAERDRMLKRYVKAGDRMVKGINAYFGSSAGQEVDQMNDARIGWQQLRVRAEEGSGA